MLLISAPRLAANRYKQIKNQIMKCENFKKILQENLDGKITINSNKVWGWKLSIKKDIELGVEIEKNANHVILTISREEPGLLDDKYPCIKKFIIKRLEQIAGAKKTIRWLDYFDIEKDSETFIENRNEKFYPKPKFHKKYFYDDAEVVKFLKELISK